MRRYILILLCLVASLSLQSQIVNTIAGNGTNGCGSGGGSAINLAMSTPADVVADAYGNKYISVYGCHVIIKVNPAGIASIFAGTGTAGNSGNGGPASSALLYYPFKLAIDREGNLIFTEMGNYDVRKIDLNTGTISLLAAGFSYPFGLSFDSQNNVIVGDYSEGLKKIDHETHDVTSFPNSTGWGFIWGVAVDNNDNVFYSTTQQKIYYYNTATATNSLYAGTGNTAYNGENLNATEVNMNQALDLHIDNQGNLIYAEYSNYRIRKIDNTTLLVTTIVGNGVFGYSGDGGLATDASIGGCYGIFIDDCNHVYFTDIHHNVVRKSSISYMAAETPVLTAGEACMGGSISIDITGSLNDATEWKLYSFGCGTIAEASTTGSSISFVPVASGTFYIRGEGPCVSIGTCGYLNISLADDPDFSLQPMGTSLCEGQSHSMNALATGGMGSLSYFWEASSDGISWAEIPGANTESYTTPAMTETRYYRCRAESTGEGCDVAFSEIASIQVTPLPANDLCANATIISTLPFNSGMRNNHCAGSDIPANPGCSGYDHNVWFKVTGTGYRMRASTESLLTDFDTEIHIYSGSCGSLEEITCNDNYGTGLSSIAEWCSTEGVSYYISVGSNATDGETGNYVLSLSDFPLSAPTFNPGTLQICEGGTVSLNATPGTNGDQLAWFEGTCGGSQQAGNATWNYTPAQSTDVFVQTRSSVCPDAASECVSAHIDVYDDITISSEPAGNTICTGGSHSMNVMATGGFQALSYQWQVSPDNITYSNITDAGFADYTVNNATSSAYYRCVISTTGAGCGDAYSTPAMLSVVSDITFTQSPIGAMLCSGDFHSMSVTTTGGTPSVQLQWQFSSNGTVWENITGENANSYVCGPLSESAYYRVLAASAGNGCGQATSNIALVSVNDNTAPVPVLSILPDLNGQCEVSVVNTPQASDNCDGTISATTDDELFYDAQGSYLILWTYTDAANNSSQQYQWVNVSDNTAPVPDLATLPVINSQCYAEITTSPTATDNCSGNITGTTIDPLVYTEQGTFYVEWRYTDEAGNYYTQFQTVIVNDDILPSLTCAPDAEVDAAPNHYYFVIGSQFDPVANNDNCAIDYQINNFNNAASLSGALLPEGVNEILWTVVDAAGNESSCTINITVNEWVGISDNKTNGLKLYPNPNYGKFSIEVIDSSDSFCIKLFDISGKLLFDGQIPVHGNKADLDFSHVAKGHYLIQVESGNRVMTETLVIE